MDVVKAQQNSVQHLFADARQMGPFFLLKGGLRILMFQWEGEAPPSYASGNVSNQQDTEEYPNQRGAQIGVFRESTKGGIKGEVKRGEVVGECRGPEGERGREMREKGWEEIGRKRTRKTLILVSL